MLESTNTKVEYIGKYKVVHHYPNITEEENDKRKQEILLKIYNYFSNQNKRLDTKVK